MATISLKAEEPSKAVPLLREALRLEAQVVRQALTRTRANVERLRNLLGVDLEAVRRGEVEHTEDREGLILELEGELEFLGCLEENQRQLETIEICP